MHHSTALTPMGISNVRDNQLRKQIQTSDHQIQQFHWFEKNILGFANKPVPLNIENNDPFLAFPLVL